MIITFAVGALLGTAVRPATNPTSAMPAPPLAAFALALVAALATMLGWALAASRRRWSPRVFGFALLLAGIAMIAVSLLDLVPTALRHGLSPLPAGCGWGRSGRGGRPACDRRPDGTRRLRLSRSALLVAVAIGLHNVPEGAAPVAAALLSWQAGIVTAIAVGLHNIPEGLAVAVPALAGGASRTRAFWLTAVATGGEIAGAALALAFAGMLSGDRTAALLAFVAGVMVTLSLVELLPSSRRLLRAA